jgi:chromosome segregation ATPase
MVSLSFKNQIREVTREMEEIKVIRNEAIVNAKEWQGKIKTLEQTVQQLMDEKDLVDRQRRQAQAERDELQQELAAIGSGK